jgi:CheY-like chemotaxis protein
VGTILIVDDESNIRFLVRITLEDEGFEVVEAHHGVAALDRVHETPPDVVVTDLMMPVMAGRELIERLRSDAQTASIPIIILSANDKLEQGLADVALGKPFDPQLLLEAIQSLIPEGHAR